MEVVVQTKPEMDEDDLKELTDNFIRDLYGIENIDNFTGIEKYKKEKEHENTITLIAKVLNTLNEKDKEKALKVLNEKADNKFKRNSYENLVKMIQRSIRKKQEEKLRAQKEAAKEIEQSKKSKNGSRGYERFIAMIKKGVRGTRRSMQEDKKKDI